MIPFYGRDFVMLMELYIRLSWTQSVCHVITCKLSSFQNYVIVFA